eukprot:Skav225483  [mRNA]  locus=C8723190:140:406:- [translate_table: standard]
MAEYLTVSPQAQTMLIQLHIKLFAEGCRRLRSNSSAARARIRASNEEFEKLVDYACIFAALRNAAQLARCDKTVDEKLMEAFLAKQLA